MPAGADRPGRKEPGYIRSSQQKYRLLSLVLREAKKITGNELQEMKSRGIS